MFAAPCVGIIKSNHSTLYNVSISTSVAQSSVSGLYITVASYFPEYKYKGYTCQSWICDPQLREMLSEDSNIIKFAKRFKSLTIKNDGSAVFSFVFKKMDNNFKIEDLPENTTLEKVLKNHYLNGKAIYSHEGYILK